MTVLEVPNDQESKRNCDPWIRQIPQWAPKLVFHQVQCSILWWCEADLWFKMCGWYDYVSDGDENHNHGLIRPDEFRRQYQVDSYRHTSGRHISGRFLHTQSTPETLFNFSQPFRWSLCQISRWSFCQAGDLPQFDLVFSFSSVEHSGLGRHSWLPYPTDFVFVFVYSGLGRHTNTPNTPSYLFISSF